jgi:hypothetical protein
MIGEEEEEEEEEEVLGGGEDALKRATEFVRDSWFHAGHCPHRRRGHSC